MMEQGETVIYRQAMVDSELCTNLPTSNEHSITILDSTLKVLQRRELEVNLAIIKQI